MITIPLPFVVAILLVVLLLEVVRRDEDFRAKRTLVNGPFVLLIMLSILQSVLLGLRWGYGLRAPMYLMPVVAALVPPLVYAGVAKLVSSRPMTRTRQVALYLLPATLIILLMMLWRNVLDVAVALIFLAHAAAILALMRPGSDALRRMPFENTTPAFRSILLAAFALAFSAMLDLYVFFDFSEGGGAHAMAAITTGNLAVLFILSAAAAIATRNQPPEEPTEPAPSDETEADREVIGKVSQLLAERQIYRDAELTLERLARKALIPARQISGAINRSTGKNVSQYVNEYRIAAACDLLASSEKSVTEIMLEVGFQTKSNFNREFRRVTDMTPIEWRSKHQVRSG